MKIEKQCLECGKTIYAYPTRVERKKYCSHACRMLYRYKTENWDLKERFAKNPPPNKKPPVKNKVCEYCKVTYLPTGSKQRWCVTCVPDADARSRMQRYNISESEYDIMLQESEGKCYLCGDVKKRLVVDHDHKTGKVRKLLCDGCNSALNRFEMPEWRERASIYIT